MKHRTEETIRYFETDRMKVAHHTSYLVWFEAGRTSLMDEAGYPYRQMEEEGVFLPVVEYSCRIMDSADYSDRVEIETWIEILKNRLVVFAYRALKDGKCIAVGRTKHLAVDSSNRARRIPSKIVDSLKPYTEI